MLIALVVTPWFASRGQEKKHLDFSVYDEWNNQEDKGISNLTFCRVMDYRSSSQPFANAGITFISGIVAALTATKAGRLYNRFLNHQRVISLLPFAGWLCFLSPSPKTISSQLHAGLVSGFTTMTCIRQTLSPPLSGMVLSYSSLEYLFITGSRLLLFPNALTLVRRYVFDRV